MSESKLVDLEDSEEKVERVEEDSNVSFSSSPTPLSISQEEKNGGTEEKKNEQQDNTTIRDEMKNVDEDKTNINVISPTKSSPSKNVNLTVDTQQPFKAFYENTPFSPPPIVKMMTDKFGPDDFSPEKHRDQDRGITPSVNLATFAPSKITPNTKDHFNTKIEDAHNRFLKEGVSMYTRRPDKDHIVEGDEDGQQEEEKEAIEPEGSTEKEGDINDFSVHNKDMRGSKVSGNSPQENADYKQKEEEQEDIVVKSNSPIPDHQRTKNSGSSSKKFISPLITKQNIDGGELLVVEKQNSQDSSTPTWSMKATIEKAIQALSPTSVFNDSDESSIEIPTTSHIIFGNESSDFNDLEDNDYMKSDNLTSFTYQDDGEENKADEDDIQLDFTSIGINDTESRKPLTPKSPKQKTYSKQELAAAKRKALIMQHVNGWNDFLHFYWGLFLSRKRSELFCFAFVMVAMFGELFPLSPAYNTTLALSILYLRVNRLKGFENQQHHANFYSVYAAVIIFSLISDISWMAKSSMYSTGLNSSLPFYEPHLLNFSLTMCIFTFVFKIYMCSYEFTKSFSGQLVLDKLTYYGSLIMPPIFGARRHRLLKEIYSRLIVLTWMYLFASITYIAILCTMAAVIPRVGEYPGTLLQIPVTAWFVLKFFTTFFVFLAFYRNVSVLPFLSVFGCLSFCKEWAILKESKKRASYGVISPPVLITTEWSKTIMVFKSLDWGLTIILWWSIFDNYDGYFVNAEPSVKHIFTWILTLSSIMDIWVPFIGLCTAWLVSVYLYRKSLKGSIPEEQVDMWDIEGGLTASRKWAAFVSLSEELEEEQMQLARMESGSEGDSESIDLEDSTKFVIEEEEEDTEEEEDVNLSKKEEVEEIMEDEHVVFNSAFQFKPENFMSLWDSLSVASTYKCKVQYAPTLAKIVGHLESSCFYVIATGEINDTTKVYACANGFPKSHPSNDPNKPIPENITFLMEMLLTKEDDVLQNLDNNILNISFKCEQDEAYIPSFVKQLKLASIVGTYEPITN